MKRVYRAIENLREKNESAWLPDGQYPRMTSLKVEIFVFT